MLEGIKESEYKSYLLQTTQDKIMPKASEKVIAASYDAKQILNNLHEYTYSEEDIKAVEGSSTANKLLEQYEITKEELYELHRRGFNLENLLIEEPAAGMKTANESAGEKATGKQNQTKQKIEYITQGQDNMYLNALTSTKPITINTLYENCFKGNYKKSTTNYSKEDVDNILQMNKLSPTEDNRWAASKLLAYGLAVGGDAVSRLQNIKSAVASLNEGNYDQDEILVEPNKVNYSEDYIHHITDKLGTVTDEHIEYLIERKSEINIDNLTNVTYEKPMANSSGGVEPGEEIQPEAVAEAPKGKMTVNPQEGATNSKGEQQNKEQQVQDIKDQINVIRAKLTTEAAQKISEKMPLESSKLMEIVQELNAQEEAKVVEALENVQLPVTDENIEAVKQIVDATAAIHQYPVETVQLELRSNGEESIENIHMALKAYEENETPVEARFKEDITKVEGQISGLLEREGIEVTVENIEAAKALITNGLEVNLENIQNVMDVVLKVNTFLEEMTPTQAALMIKEGVNPYYSSIDQLLDWMSEDKLESLKTSVSESIVALEEQNIISREQKETLIGLYRIMQSVVNNKEEVVGYIFKNELPLTIERLQEATRYINQKNHIEAVVDDETGELEEVNYKMLTSRQLLEAGQQKAQKTLDILKTLEEMELPVSESNISKLSKVSALLYPYIKEQFKKEIGQFDGLSTLPKSFLDKLEVVQNTSSETLSWMQEKEIPLTLSNIYWVDKMMNEPETYTSLLQEEGMLKKDLPEDLKAFEESLKKLQEEAKQHKEQASLSGDMSKYRSYKQIEEALSTQKQIIDKEGVYQIPFIINGEERIVNLLVHEDGKGVSADDSHLKAEITYKTKNLGTVKAYIEIKGDNMGYRVIGENLEATERLQSFGKELNSMLSGIGYNIGYTDYVSEVKEKQDSSSTLIKHEDSSFEEMI